jgi:hypothetical protein
MPTDKERLARANVLCVIAALVTAPFALGLALAVAYLLWWPLTPEEANEPFAGFGVLLVGGMCFLGLVPTAAVTAGLLLRRWSLRRRVR